MLTGAQLATAITAVLVAAIALGWVLHWIWARLAGAATAARLADMDEELAQSNSAREAAEQARSRAESMLATLETETEDRLAQLQGLLDAMIDTHEIQLSAVRREAREDAEASISELASARQRIAELEAQIEAMRIEERG